MFFVLGFFDLIQSLLGLVQSILQDEIVAERKRYLAGRGVVYGRMHEKLYVGLFELIVSDDGLRLLGEHMRSTGVVRIVFEEIVGKRTFFIHFNDLFDGLHVLMIKGIVPDRFAIVFSMLQDLYHLLIELTIFQHPENLRFLENFIVVDVFIT